MGVCPMVEPKRTLQKATLQEYLKSCLEYSAKSWALTAYQRGFQREFQLFRMSQVLWLERGVYQFWWSTATIGDDQVFVWKLPPQPNLVPCRTETLSIEDFLSHWMRKLGSILPTCYICYGRVKQDELATTTCHHPDKAHASCRAKWGVKCPLCRQLDPLFRPVARFIPFEEIWRHGRHSSVYYAEPTDRSLMEWAVLTGRLHMVPFENSPVSATLPTMFQGFQVSHAENTRV